MTTSASTEPQADPHTKAREALMGHINSWRHKHGLSLDDAHRLLLEHVKQASKKRR